MKVGDDEINKYISFLARIHPNTYEYAERVVGKLLN